MHRVSLSSNFSEINKSLFLEYEEYISLALNDIEKEYLAIEIQEEEAELRLKKTEILIISVIFIITLLFIFFSIRHILFVRKRIIEPIQSINMQTRTILQDDSDENLSTLQEKIQSIVSFVEKETTSNPEKKKEFREHILKNEYHEIISFLKLRNEVSKATTMKDIKINLRMTHPTLMIRLKYLEEHSYIEITKNGRDKIISLL